MIKLDIQEKLKSYFDEQKWEYHIFELTPAWNDYPAQKEWRYFKDRISVCINPQSIQFQVHLTKHRRIVDTYQFDQIDWDKTKIEDLLSNAMKELIND